MPKCVVADNVDIIPTGRVKAQEEADKKEEKPQVSRVAHPDPK